MIYLKEFENFNTDFKKGETVLCINDESTPKLKYGEKYIVTEDYGTGHNIRICDLDKNDIGYWGKFRFIKLQDLEKWLITNKLNKYNL